MRNSRKLSKILSVIFASAVFSIFAIYLNTMMSIPAELVIIKGEESVYNFKSPFVINIRADKENILKINGGDLKTSGTDFSFSRPIAFSTDKNGSVKLNLKLFGLLPVKTVNVNILSGNKLAACGNTIGVKMYTQGILVIGVSYVEMENGQKIAPFRNTTFKPGYLIIEVNDKIMESIDDLINEIDKCAGNSVKILYKYDGAIGTAFIKPVKAIDDKKYHLGLWVRDSTAGIGTLTFYDPLSKNFGALGHGITDIDTGLLMPVESGEILESNILGVKVGKAGVPGELKGIFIEDTMLGVIEKNSDTGIYGKLKDNSTQRLIGKIFPIGLKSEIKEGTGTILSNIDGKTIKEYKIQIQKVSRQNTNGSKGMIIKITDEVLLSATGGIVQGMSGSPIIQNGKIIGAVTHVLINDPTRGYGIFIETMLKNIAGNNVQK